MTTAGEGIYWNLSTVANVTSAPDKVHHYALYEVVLIAIVAGFLSVVTVVGNLMVMISFKMDKQLQTISNYFLLSLAIADFAIGLISMPLFTVYTVLGSWVLGPIICDTWLSLDYLMSNASVLNLLIISFDRYFSVTRPLTYRARRTTRRAIFMIACAWIISLIMWPPWIYSWPYIEGSRSVPDDECYIQFLETNLYITFGTAIAAFYFPVTIMIILYWRIWRETEKRQKDLTHLQAGGRESSKRSTSSDEVQVQEADAATAAMAAEWVKRARGDSATNTTDELETTYVPTAMCIENPRYLKVPGRTRQLPPTPPTRRTWRELVSTCLRNFRVDRDTDVAEEDSTSEAGHGSPGTTTPASAETPIQSSVSRCTSLTLRPDPFSSAAARPTTDPMIPLLDRGRGPALPALPQLAPHPRSQSTDSVYTILIRFPTETSLDCGVQPSIKMIMEEEEGGSALPHTQIPPANRLESPLRRPSQPPLPMKLPLNAKLVPRPPAKAPPKKKKKKIAERKQDRKAAKTLSAILLAFILTWTPYNVLVLIRTLSACNDDCISQELWDFSYYLCYINSTINPLCYALCNASFRRTYIRILTCKWHMSRPGAARAFYN